MSFLVDATYFSLLMFKILLPPLRTMPHISSLVPQVLHYVEKPETFVSNIINAGAYLFTPEIFKQLGKVFQTNHENELM